MSFAEEYRKQFAHMEKRRDELKATCEHVAHSALEFFRNVAEHAKEQLKLLFTFGDESLQELRSIAEEPMESVQSDVQEAVIVTKCWATMCLLVFCILRPIGFYLSPIFQLAFSRALLAFNYSFVIPLFLSMYTASDAHSREDRETVLLFNTAGLSLISGYVFSELQLPFWCPQPWIGTLAAAAAVTIGTKRILLPVCAFASTFFLYIAIGMASEITWRYSFWAFLFAIVHFLDVLTISVRIRMGFNYGQLQLHTILIFVSLHFYIYAINGVQA